MNFVLKFILWVFNIYATVFDYIVSSNSFVVQISALSVFALMVGASYGIFMDAFNVVTAFLSIFVDFMSLFVQGISFAHGLTAKAKLTEFVTALTQAFRETDATKQA